MNLQIAFVLLVIIGSALARPQDNRGTAPVSEEALDKALSDRRYLLRQLKCTLGEAPCDTVGRKLKSLAPLVLRGSCPQCTPSETRQIQKALAYIQKNFPKEWNKILQQYSSG